MDSRLAVKELIRFTTHAYFDKKKYPISQTSVLKILYKIKGQSVNTYLDDYLQFYWYEHGPYSPLILELKDEMQTEGIIQETARGWITQKSRIIQHDELLQNIRDQINRIINESNSDSSASLINDIYATDAPYRFYISFKNTFMAALDSFYRDPNTHIKSDRLITILQEGIGDLPNETIFSDFKYIYVDFIDLMSAILEAKKISDLGYKLQLASTELFRTFAKGVRILHHDPYYQPQIENWKEQFDGALSDMENKLFNLYHEAQRLSIKNIHLSTLDELIQQILALKATKKLASVSFLPPIKDESVNYGNLGGTIFNHMTDPDFKGYLQKFHYARKAIINKVENNNLVGMTYHLVTS